LSSETGCPPLGRRWVTYNTTEIECPFQQSICANNTAIRLDTGLVDSHLQLGINTKKKDRVSTRWVSDCAPINQIGHRSDWLSESDSNLTKVLNSLYEEIGVPPSQDSAARSIMFNYGQNIGFNTPLGAATNLTFIFSNTTLSLWRLPFIGLSEYASYSLEYVYPNTLIQLSNNHF
jgi:hypothetical protein